jgi:phosphopantothenoylcysteine decarboxylase / phosphopantothenate---cysteine ligase
VGILAGKRVVLGVTGSIANYKILELARQLTVGGALVDAVMTEEATRFVTPLAFQSLTYRPVYSEMWSTLENAAAHVKLGQEADVVLVAPATAHTIASIAAGLADNLILTTILSTTAPILIVPAMETHMWHNAATQDNVALLRRRGIEVLEPDEGLLASGISGRGRMPGIDRVEGELRALLGRAYGRMRGRKVVVTAGGTHESIDPVRFIGNRASGQMGYAIATAARDEGADVTLISGPVALDPPAAVTHMAVESARDMHDAVHESIGGADLLIMNAAVADYRPAQAVDHKLKKSEAGLTVLLEPTVDILQSLADQQHMIKVGFAAETDDLLRYAADKLERKRLDLIVANDAVRSIGRDEIEITLLDRDGGRTTLPRQPKSHAAEALIDQLLARWPERLSRAAQPRSTHER